MYERSAIILENYFNKLFGYDEKNNLKDNFLKYSNLVDCSAKYKEATDSEDKVMQEYDDVANKIKSIQKNQEILSKKSIKFQEEMDIIFQNIGEEASNIKKMFEELDRNIDENNEKIKQNEQEFIEVISKFSEKSEVRNNLGKERKKVETDYSMALNDALEIYKNIDKEKLQNIRDFFENSAEFEKELYEKMKKNGESEKVPFDSNVLKNAIKLEMNIQKKEADILCNGYDKTSRLFSEIKNNSTKIERHKKQIKDSIAKINFLSALKEYLIQFLDNERLAAVSGESEHKKQMKEACKNFENDLIQINNMYELLLKETAGKANKKMYKELYNIEYLRSLEKDSENFEKEISKLNFIGTVIDPNRWRLEGMKKIYSAFYKDVTESYGRNMSDFELEDNKKDDKLNVEKDKNLSKIKAQKIVAGEENDEEADEALNEIKSYDEEEEDENKTEEDDIDEKIDMILGFDKKDSKINKKTNGIARNDNPKKSFAKNNDKEDEDENFLEDDWDFEEQNDLGNDSEYIEQEDLEDDDWDDEIDDDGFLDDYDDFEEEKEYSKSENRYEKLEDDDFYDDYDDDDFYDEALEDDFFDDYDEEDDDYDEHNLNKKYEKDDNPWDDDDNELYIKKESEEINKRNSVNSGASRGKSEKGKHNKNDEKSRGLLGKFIK